MLKSMMNLDFSTESHYFEQDSLQQTFSLLRPKHPSLALVVQNVIAKAKLSPLTVRENEPIAVSLEPKTVSDIIYSLSHIGDQACQDHNLPKEQLIVIRAVLLEWLIYAQHYLGDEAP